MKMVYPVVGRLIHDPVTMRVVTEEGLQVSEYDVFWAARLKDGDVTETAPVRAKAKE
jgi:hypothetical protein